MGGHERRKARHSIRSKRNKLDSIETGSGVMHNGQTQVTVNGCVAMPRKVLAARKHAALLETTRKRDSKRCDDVRSRSKRSIPNDGIVRVRINVENGSKVEVETKRSKRSTEVLANVRGEVTIIGHTQSSHGRKRRKPSAEASDASSFLVNSDKRGKFFGTSRANGRAKRMRRRKVGHIALEQDRATSKSFT